MEHVVKRTALKENNIEATTNVNEEIPDKFIIDSNHVQIRVSTEELNRRIKSFIERKRDQVNIANVREFCHRLVSLLLLKYIYVTVTLK